MREILFRGKRVDNGEWVYGDLCHGEYDKIIILYDNDAVMTSKKNELISWGFIEVVPETVGQYTGMTDKNANKIFEGDILELSGSYEEIDGTCVDYIEHYEVKYKNAAFYACSPEHKVMLSELINSVEVTDFCVILGNIHDGI